MKFTFQTFCIAVAVTFLHLSAIAVGSAWFGVPSETDGKKKTDLSKIAEEFLDDSRSNDHKPASSSSKEEGSTHPLAPQDPSPQEPSSGPALSEHEPPAMVEASDLAGRVERPSLDDYAAEETDTPPIMPSRPTPPAATEESAGPHSIRAIQPTTRS